MATLSNEAEALHQMCTKIRDLNEKNPTSKVLAHLFGVKPESAEYFAFMSAIRLRFQRFLEVVDQSNLNERHQANVRSAVRQLVSFTNSQYWQNPWYDTKTKVFSDTHLMALDMVGSGLSNVAPVVVFTKEEQAGYIDDLHRALSEIEGAEDFAAQLVANSIRTAIKMIELFDIFGSAAIGEKLFETYAITKQAAEVAPKGRRRAYTSAATIVAIALGGFVYADSVMTAFENFYTRTKTIAQILSLPNSAAQKLLPPPGDDPSTKNGHSNEDRIK